MKNLSFQKTLLASGCLFLIIASFNLYHFSGRAIATCLLLTLLPAIPSGIAAGFLIDDKISKRF